MKIREKILNIRQRALAIYSILIATVLVFSIGFLTWYADDSYKDNHKITSVITSQTSYDSCVREAENIINKLKRSETERILSQIKAFQDCREIWSEGKLVKTQPESFASFILKDFDELALATLLFSLGLYILVSTYVLHAKCQNLGWKRLAISVALISGLVVGLLVYDEVGPRIKDEEYFVIIFGSIAAYISTIFIILGGRQVIIWIKEGFHSAQ